MPYIYTVYSISKKPSHINGTSSSHLVNNEVVYLLHYYINSTHEQYSCVTRKSYSTIMCKNNLCMLAVYKNRFLHNNCAGFANMHYAKHQGVGNTLHAQTLDDLDCPLESPCFVESAAECHDCPCLS